MNRLPVLILILLLTSFLIFSCSDKSAPETESSGYESDQSVNSSEYSSEEGGTDMEEVILNIKANGHTFIARFEDNSSARALKDKLMTGPVEIEMHDYGNFEKVGALPWTLPRNDISITTVPGDVILYQGDNLTIIYDENTWTFTRVARIEGVTREGLLNAFGEGNVTVTIALGYDTDK